MENNRKVYEILAELMEELPEAPVFTVCNEDIHGDYFIWNIPGVIDVDIVWYFKYKDEIYFYSDRICGGIEGLADFDYLLDELKDDADIENPEAYVRDNKKECILIRLEG